MDIVVLAGGLSTERDVSFVTGNMVSKALRKNGHRVILLDVFMGYSDKKEDISDIFEHTEEVSVQVEEIPTVAPDLAAVKASRADQSDNFFGPNVIEICQKADVVFIRMKRGEQIREFSKTGLNLPCVVKPCCGGSSIGVSIVRTVEEYEEALEEAFRWEEEILIEDYIEGREFSVGVLEGKALPIIEIAPVEGFYDYKNKYKAGSAVETCPAQLSEAVTKQMQQYAVEVTKVLGLGAYSRMDFLLDSREQMYCLEANTLPGMTPTSLLPQEAQAVGVSFEQLCEKLIELSLKKYA